MIFLDNASTTKADVEAMEIALNASVNDYYFNPSAKYKQGIDVSRKLKEAKERLLKLVHTDLNKYSVVFTGSATEANNLVLNSSLSKHKGNIISAGEHASVYETAKHFTSLGYKMAEVKLTKSGHITEQELIKVMDKDTAFISFILVSNETGAISPLEKVIKKAKSINPKVLVHVDAVQAFGKIDIDILKLGADYMTVSSHKIHGPKGVGALIYRNGVKLLPHILGGGQEDGLRSGTENLPGILGFIYSAEKMCTMIKENYTSVQNFKTELIRELETGFLMAGIEARFNSVSEEFSPYILSLSVLGYKGEVLLRALETEGVLVGTGSACSSKHAGNRTLESMGKTKEEILGNIRLSFSAETTKLNPKEVAEKIIKGIQKVKR